jgi:hypothetical protein
MAWDRNAQGHITLSPLVEYQTLAFLLPFASPERIKAW